VSAQPIEPRLARLEGAYEQVRDRLNGIDHRLETMESKIDLRADRLDSKIEGLARRFDTNVDRLDAKIDKRSAQLIGLVLTTWATTIATILLHH